MPLSPSLHSLAESGFELRSVGLSIHIPNQCHLHSNSRSLPHMAPFPDTPAPALSLPPSLGSVCH